ncbi:permease [Opitutaceae bacterium EW11]|nr:permease [Opitutaceae bacterium EW11]
MNDVRIALRHLFKAPAFTCLALLTLALGIGVNTSMFSVVKGLLLNRGPFPEAERLVEVIGLTPRGEMREFSPIELREIREQTTTFGSLTTLQVTPFTLSEPGKLAQHVTGCLVSEDFFTTFGVQPALGRPFLPEEHQPGRNQVVILSYSWWVSRFGADPHVIGQTLRVDGDTLTIVGVMPAAFDYPMMWPDTHMWRPLNFTREQLEWRDYRAFRLFGRLAPGQSPEAPSAQMAPLAQRQAAEHPESYAGLRYRMVPLREALVDSLGRRVSWMLLGLSGFVLLIACANLANLQLARAVTRAREFAVRSALGASRWILIKQQLTESVVLSVAGGALGLGVAALTNRVIERNYLVGGRSTVIAIDPPVLLVTLLVSVATGVLFGLVPALIGSRTNMLQALKQQTRGSTSGRGHHRLRQALVIGEVALALVLLGGAAQLHRSFVRFLQRDSGWDSARVTVASLPVPEARVPTYEARLEFFRKLEARMDQLPGVEHAALATSLPILGYSGARVVLRDDQTPADAARLSSAFHVMVTSNYFATLGIPLLRGTLFAPDIKQDSPQVVIVNESLAKQLWPGEDPIGKRLGSMDSGQAYWAQVIGVVKDVQPAAALDHPSTRFVVYKPLVQEAWSYVQMVVRSPVPAGQGEALRRAVAEVDPELPADLMGTVSQIAAYDQRNLRLAAKILNGFAGLGLALAAVGIFGVISNVVAQRSAEFGIRLALGAEPRGVLMLVLRHGLNLFAGGLALGLLGAYALSRFLASIMPRLAEASPLPLLAVAFVLFLVALTACYLPARRATRVNPVDALRTE